MKNFMSLHRKIKKFSEAFTIIEVVIAAAIFALAMAGVFASVSQLRAPAVESSQEVTAAFIGKQILENLRSQVNAQNWSSGSLVAGAAYGPHTAGTYGGKTYTYTYTVESDPDGTGARRVNLMVSW